MKNSRIGILATAVVLLACANANAGVLYRVIDLGTLPGTGSSYAFAVNNSGQAVGMSAVGDDMHAFLYDSAAMLDLGVLGNGQLSTVANDINDSGQVVGHSFGVTTNNRPFLYSNGTMTNLGTLGGNFGNANGINSAGDVVGIASDVNGVTHAFLWSAGVMQDLGAFPDVNGFQAYSNAYAINDAGQVVGYSVPGAATRAFLWENGMMSDLGDLFGGAGSAAAYDINNFGQEVGQSYLDPNTAQPFLWNNGTMLDLGNLPGQLSGYARGINDLGQVVGMSGLSAFLWDSASGLRNLNDLIDASGAGWQLTHAYEINENGQIVGFGINPDGQVHAYMLETVPEPASILMWTAIGSAMAVASRQRRRLRAVPAGHAG